MATISDLRDFVAGLPEDARAVLVVQRGTHPFVLRTDSLTLGKKLEKEKFPNWPRAVWEGMSQATGGMPLNPGDDDDTIDGGDNCGAEG